MCVVFVLRACDDDIVEARTRGEIYPEVSRSWFSKFRHCVRPESVSVCNLFLQQGSWFAETDVRPSFIGQDMSSEWRNTTCHASCFRESWCLANEAKGASTSDSRTPWKRTWSGVTSNQSSLCLQWWSNPAGTAYPEELLQSLKKRDAAVSPLPVNNTTEQYQSQQQRQHSYSIHALLHFVHPDLDCTVINGSKSTYETLTLSA